MFKTPWEFYRSERPYDVVLCSCDTKFEENGAKLILIYAGHDLSCDSEKAIQVVHKKKNTLILAYNESRFPIYGDCVIFPGMDKTFLVDGESHEPTIYLDQSSERTVARIGYDLFCEIHMLLSIGQPPANADIPTLDLHIALLRDLIVASGVLLVEIPPVPEGHQFIACLTHDVDHPSIRHHKFDHTMFGFLYRAIFGSVVDVLRGKAPLRNLLTNWAAAVKLPLVYLGLAKDFWLEFTQYTTLEQGSHSSFFVIPFEGCPGRSSQGKVPNRRASRYSAADVAGPIRELMSRGCEIGLHGIDAWLDCSKGREELEQIRRITGMPDIGVRMHWLYYNEQSPVTLETAGADYDSTVGYNETVGYRAGTTQVYKPLNASRLLELPLHIMDTALFYPNYLDLSPREARKKLSGIIDHAVQFGGSVTVNWHDRSIAPERLWGDSYVQLIQEFKNKGAWFATAAEAVSWFRKRRSATFENVSWDWDLRYGKTAVDIREELPGLRLRVHNWRGPQEMGAIDSAASARTRDLSLKHCTAEGSDL